MKKMIIAILSVFMLVGCSSKPVEKKNEKETGVVEESNKEKKEATNEKKMEDEVVENQEVEESKTGELNHEELLNGNFSSIAGKYVNSKGEVIEINNEGLRTDIDERANGEVTYQESSLTYGRSMWMGDGPVGGYVMIIYPVGTEVIGLDTDITKIRIAYGHDLPVSLEYIYTKK